MNATKFELIKKALATGYSVAIDQSINLDRIALTKKVVERYADYSFFTVFLFARKEVLIERVLQRPQLPGKYKETVDELLASIKKYEGKYGTPNLKDFDLDMNVSENNPEQIAAALIRKAFFR